MRDAVKQDSKERLSRAESHRRVEGEADHSVAHGTEIVVVPQLPGFDCYPPEQRFVWSEEWQRAEFTIWVDPHDRSFTPDSAINGSLSFYVETVVIAKLPISIFIAGSQSDRSHSEASCNPYASIFVSYSREDEAVVDRITRAIATIGATIVRDRDVLKSGQNWDAQLLRLIESADIFQLYWSMAAKRSKPVEREWRHALAQPKSDFVHPFYWRCPFPTPPRELQPIHFHYYPLDMEPGFVDRPDMVVIPAGAFLMGSSQGEGDYNERPQHKVTISKPFAIGRFPVTFDEYDRFVRATGQRFPRDCNWGRGCRPVIWVSWHDAVAYCTWLSEQTEQNYRLPTEAEWEYACRAGMDTPYFWGESPEEAHKYAVLQDDALKMTQLAGKKEANPWGLYDMVGNVWEWCQDCRHGSHGNYDGAPSDGTAWLTARGINSSRRVLRGGSWSHGPEEARSANRGSTESDYRLEDVGFRLARTL